MYTDYNRILGQRESGNNYGIANDRGYLGRWQFGADALHDLGLVSRKPAGVSNKVWLSSNDNWTGRYGIRNQQQFLDNPQVQDQVMSRWNGILDQRTSQYGLDKFVGQTINGQYVSADGIRAASHLLGHGKVINALKNNQWGDVDGNGVGASEYMQLFGNQQPKAAPPQPRPVPSPQATAMFTASQQTEPMRELEQEVRSTNGRMYEQPEIVSRNPMQMFFDRFKI